MDFVARPRHIYILTLYDKSSQDVRHFVTSKSKITESDTVISVQNEVDYNIPDANHRFFPLTTQQKHRTYPHGFSCASSFVFYAANALRE